MNHLQVSASIVAYHSRPEELAGAIRSVLAARLNAACTVVDNSSTSALRECVLDAGARYIHPGPNLGFSAAHNLVLEANRKISEYSLIQNPDVQFSPKVVETLYAFMQNNREVGLVMPRIYYPDGTEQHLCKLLPTPFDLLNRRFLGRAGRAFFSRQAERYELCGLDMSVPREIPCLSGCFMFIRSSVLDAVGLFDERFFMYMEDVDMCRRIGGQAKTVFFPHASITHRYDKGSYNEASLLFHHLQSAIRYFGKWGWFRDPDREKLNGRIAPLAAEVALGADYLSYP